MKSFIAVCLALIPEFTALALQKPLWLAFSYDEEVGCLGAPYLLAHIVKHIPKPAFAVIGEPTSMQVVTAHKGVLSFETVVHGLEAHSSQPQLGVNAVHIACEMVQFLTGMASELAKSGMRDGRFEPPYSTVHVGTIDGGTARNIIPRECRFQWEIRPLPGDDHEMLITRFNTRCAEMVKEMKKKSAQADIVTQARSRMAGVTLPASAHASCKTVMRCAQTNREHAVSFGTEAGVFNDHGVPAIICGPGSIEQAHKPNEFIDVSQIRTCIEFMLRLTADDSFSKQ
jgi:acetylornithine deacetylase